MDRLPRIAERHPAARLILICCAVVAALMGLLEKTAPGAGGQLEITVVDRDTGKPLPCRMHLKNAAGRPRTAGRAPFWNDHFVFPGKIMLRLPVGNYTFELERGPEYVVRGGYFTINNFADDTKLIDIKRFIDLSKNGWWSGDMDVRRPARDIELLMAADDLHVAEVVTWYNDKSNWGSRKPKNTLVCFDGNRYYHLMAGGHGRDGTELLYYHLPIPLKTPAKNDLYPPTIQYLLKARETPGLAVDVTRPYWWDFPMLVAHGQVDSVQVLNSNLCRTGVIADEGEGKPRDKRLFPGIDGNARWSQQIYFHLLDCGFRIPPSAGSGSGVAPNPVGYNRVYVHVDGRFNYESWWKNFRAGRVVVTNGPLLQPTVQGHYPGHVFRAEEGKELQFEPILTLSTRQPISYLEIIKNGRVEHSLRFEEYAKSGRLPAVEFKRSGWFLVRAVTDLRGTYRFAMTGPYYVEIGYQRRVGRQAARFFLDWVRQRAGQIKLNNDKQQQEVMEYHRKARDFWQDILSRANAD